MSRAERFSGGKPTAQHQTAKLKTSPYAPFAASTSPIGLYVRRCWLEEDSAALKKAEKRVTGRLLARQKRDGSFGSLSLTIRVLYAMHLLQPGGSPEADRALDWLWESGSPRAEGRRASDGVVYHDMLFRMRPGEAAGLERLNGTPFSTGCAGFVKTSAAIVLASAFGRGREVRVQRAISCLDEVVHARHGRWCAPACSNNVLQAYAAHPDASRGRPFASAIRALGARQGRSGGWPGLPFATTFAVLAGVDSREARAQVRKALPLVRRLQNRDGSWGRAGRRDVTSFQMLRALRGIEA